MANLREAAQKVVDVWKLYGTAESLRGWMEILETALAEPVQEQPICDQCGKSKSDGWALYCVGCVEPVFAQSQRPAEPVQEPVAWLLTDCIGERDLSFSPPLDNNQVIPLYAAPPQRKPLTEEEIDQAANNIFTDDPVQWWRKLARAIERAHGIT